MTVDLDSTRHLLSDFDQGIELEENFRGRLKGRFVRRVIKDEIDQLIRDEIDQLIRIAPVIFCCFRSTPVKAKELAKLLKKIPDSDRNTVPTKSIADFLGRGYISKTSKVALLDEASIEEIQSVFEFMQASGTPYQPCTPDQVILVTLLTNPPEDPDYFKELVLRTKIFRPARDHQALNKLLPQVVVTAEETKTVKTEKSNIVNSMARITYCGQSIFVDEALLKEQSSWFATEMQYEPGEIPIRTHLHFKHLWRLLKNLNDLSKLWQPLVKEKKNEYLALFQAARFYGFNRLLVDLGLALIESCLYECDDELEIAQRVVALDLSDTDKIAFNKMILRQLVKYSGRVQNEGDNFGIWLDFGFAHSYTSTMSVFLGSYANNYPPLYAPHDITLWKRRAKTPFIQTVILQKLADALDPSSFHSVNTQLYPTLDPQFTEWCVQMMESSPAPLITTKNFKLLYETVSWSKHKCIKDALKKFAANPANSDLVKLWPVGTVPAEIVEQLPLIKRNALCQ